MTTATKKPPKFAYLSMENSIFARFARAFFIFWHFEDVLVLSTTWKDLFCSCVDDMSMWWQMFNFIHLCPKRLFQFNSRKVKTHFLSIMTLNNWKIIAETWSYIFRWRSRRRRRRVCLSSLKSKAPLRHRTMYSNVCGTCSTIIFPRSTNHIINLLRRRYTCSTIIFFFVEPIQCHWQMVFSLPLLSSLLLIS